MKSKTDKYMIFLALAVILPSYQEMSFKKKEVYKCMNKYKAEYKPNQVCFKLLDKAGPRPT